MLKLLLQQGTCARLAYITSKILLHRGNRGDRCCRGLLAGLGHALYGECLRPGYAAAAALLQCADSDLVMDHCGPRQLSCCAGQGIC